MCTPRDGYEERVSFLCRPLSPPPATSRGESLQSKQNVTRHIINRSMLTPVKVLYNKLTASGSSHQGSHPPSGIAEDVPTELTKTHYHISLGHSTLHHWVPNEHGWGRLYWDKIHHDTKATIPRNELLNDMYNVPPWQ